MVNDAPVYKKRYRKEAIIKWKRKKLKTTCHTNVTINNRNGKLNNTVCTGLYHINEKITNESERLTKRKLINLGPPIDKSNNVDKKNSNRKGKILLQQIILSADVLPEVLCCSYCHAVKFYSETSNFCCQEGRIVLSSNELPYVMQNLLTSNSEEATLFRTYIRTYNNTFAFTSYGVRVDKNFTRQNMGIYTFRVQGQVYHFMTDLQPKEKEAKNLQLYLHDTNNEIENRLTSSLRLSKQ